MSLNGVTIYWNNNMPNGHHTLTNKLTNENMDVLLMSCWKTRFVGPWILQSIASILS